MPSEHVASVVMKYESWRFVGVSDIPDGVCVVKLFFSVYLGSRLEVVCGL